MNIAVIGSGVAGLGAAWLLGKQARVTIYDSASRPGGHSNTVLLDQTRHDPATAVDTGFIVYNLATYPNLIAFFDQLGVKTQPTNMSFAVSLDDGALEYSGDSLLTLIGHWRNALRPSHWRMIADLIRFYRSGDRLCREPADRTLGDFLRDNGYSRAFCEHHLLPMAAAIWSAVPESIMDFPVRTFGHFFRNHGLLELDANKRPPWRTVSGGSKTYVDEVLRTSGAKIVLDAAITGIEGGMDGASVSFADGRRETFDHVILATHADQALKLLTRPSRMQRDLLACFKYSKNETYLHKDCALMPRRRSLWASWNYLYAPRMAADRLMVTYWMNRLQSLSTHEPILVSLNPNPLPAADKTIARFLYEHPQFDRAAIQAQEKLRLIQGQERIWLAGSYFGYGFHEDAFASGLAVAAALGSPRPWQVTDVSPAFLNATPAHE